MPQQIKKIAKMNARKRKVLTKEPSQKTINIATEVKKKRSSKTLEEHVELERSFLDRMPDASKVKITRSAPDY